RRHRQDQREAGVQQRRVQLLAERGAGQRRRLRTDATLLQARLDASRGALETAGRTAPDDRRRRAQQGNAREHRVRDVHGPTLTGSPAHPQLERRGAEAEMLAYLALEVAEVGGW